jgi:hypothetical protein
LNLSAGADAPLVIGPTALAVAVPEPVALVAVTVQLMFAPRSAEPST